MSFTDTHHSERGLQSKLATARSYGRRARYGVDTGTNYPRDVGYRKCFSTWVFRSSCRRQFIDEDHPLHRASCTLGGSSLHTLRLRRWVPGRIQTDIPVPGYVSSYSATANDLFIEFVHPWQKMIGRLRHFPERHVRT